MKEAAHLHQLKLDFQAGAYRRIVNRCLKHLPVAEFLDDWGLEFIYYRFTYVFVQAWVHRLFEAVEEIGSPATRVTSASNHEQVITHPNKPFETFRSLTSSPQFDVSAAQHHIMSAKKITFPALNDAIADMRPRIRSQYEGQPQYALGPPKSLDMQAIHSLHRRYTVTRVLTPHPLSRLARSRSMPQNYIRSNIRRSLLKRMIHPNSTVIGPSHFPKSWITDFSSLGSVIVSNSLKAAISATEGRSRSVGPSAFQSHLPFARRGLSMSFVTDSSLLDYVLPDFLANLPIELLEGLPQHGLSHQLSENPRGPSRIVGGYFSSAADRVAIANWNAPIKALHIIQHGGGMGMYRGNIWESVETQLSDLYISAGMAKARNHDNVKCLPFFRGLHDGITRGISVSSSNFCTVVEVTGYKPHLNSRSGSETDPYRCNPEAQLVMLLARRFSSRPNEFAVSPYPHRKGVFSSNVTSVLDGTADDWPHIIPRVDLHTALMFSDLIVLTGIRGTAFLQALASGRPFLVLWTAEDFELVEEATGIGDRLKEVSVAFEGANDLAAHCMDIVDNIEQWWNTNDVLEVVEACRNEFAFNSLDAFPRWAKFLTTLTT